MPTLSLLRFLHLFLLLKPIQACHRQLIQISDPALQYIEDLNLPSVSTEPKKLEWKRLATEVALLLGLVIAHVLMLHVHALTCYVMMYLLCMLMMMFFLRP